MSNVTKLAPVEDKSNDVVAPRRRAVTATDLDTLADRFRVDMIHIFMVFLILKKKRLYFHGFNFIPKNNVMGNVLEKNWSKRV